MKSTRVIIFLFINLIQLINMDSLFVQANAKINLEFEILDKRKDGYHNIKSIFQSVDISDFILIKKGHNFISGNIVCPDSKNIILKAKNFLEEAINKKIPCQIHLHKSIPVAAGLGGGSADAAAILIGLNHLCSLGLNQNDLLEIATRVGADVPFFMHGGTCLVSGIGEKIISIKKNLSKVFVVFRPHQRIKTEMMYKFHDQSGKDFYTICREICPEIKKLESYLEKFGQAPRLSGSGPTVFVGVNDLDLAKKISEEYQNFNGDIFIASPQSEAIKIIEI